MDVLSVEIGALIALGVATAGAAWMAVRRRRAGERVTGGRGPAPEEAGIGRPVRSLRAALSATARGLRERLDAAFGTRGEREIWDALEEALLAADVGPGASRALLEGVRRDGGVADAPGIRNALRRELMALLQGGGPVAPSARPWVVLVTGVNGVGKTTTIGKLAARYVKEGRRVLLVAGDTFRAAAIEQLEAWAGRVGVDVVRHAAGADPAAVVFDGMRAAVARNVDVVIVDTAGRLHTRTPLMDELRKVRRTIAREIPGAPHEVLLVLDATTGQNALNQARAFVEAAGVTGVIATKLDGTAKGGVVVAVGRELGIPVRYVGTGEGVEDLAGFDPREFVEALLAAE